MIYFDSEMRGKSVAFVRQRQGVVVNAAGLSCFVDSLGNQPVEPDRTCRIFVKISTDAAAVRNRK